MRTNGSFGLLDILAVFGFFIGIANYTENIGQSQMQDAVNSAVDRIEKHLADQDAHLHRQDELIELLKGGQSVGKDQKDITTNS